LYVKSLYFHVFFAFLYGYDDHIIKLCMSQIALLKKSDTYNIQNINFLENVSKEFDTAIERMKNSAVINS